MGEQGFHTIFSKQHKKKQIEEIKKQNLKAINKNLQSKTISHNTAREYQ